MTLTLSETTLLEQLLQLPRLPAVAQRLDTLVADEAAQRAHFIETVLECEKAEFINGEKVVQSPAKLKHTATVGKLLHLISTYVMLHGLGWVGFEKVMVSLTRNDYEAEYWIIDPDTETVEQYRLAGDRYELAIKAQTGELRSVAAPGFVIPVRAIFDEQLNQAALRQLLQG